MIHELTHMQISEHDNSFYQLYRQLHKEAGKLLSYILENS